MVRAEPLTSRICSNSVGEDVSSVRLDLKAELNRKDGMSDRMADLDAIAATVQLYIDGAAMRDIGKLCVISAS